MGKWDKFNKTVDTEKLTNDVREIEENGGKREYQEIPEGTYEAVLARLECCENKNDEPMVKVAFRIIKGQYKGQWTWANYNLIYGLAISNLKTLLNDMEPEHEIEWDGNFAHFEETLINAFEELGEKVGVVLEIGKDKKGYPTFKVTDCWDVEEG